MSPSLSYLCTICHKQKPRYRCPRCSAGTCSLTCTRVHKSRTLCSGVRDPAAYLKRHELATPKVFDQDFNFISGLERAIELAGNDARARGLSELAPTIDTKRMDQKEMNLEKIGKKKKGKKKQATQPFEAALRKCNITLLRAPLGMKRSIDNETIWDSKAKAIRWTVEWISRNDDDREKRKLGSMLETKTIDEGYPQPVGIRSEASDIPTDLHFYLVLARQASKKQVVLALRRSDTLQSALRNQTVAEFPTLLVLNRKAETMPEEYELAVVTESKQEERKKTGVFAIIPTPKIHRIFVDALEEQPAEDQP